jgi:hypothetical protein
MPSLAKEAEASLQLGGRRHGEMEMDITRNFSPRQRRITIFDHPDTLHQSGYNHEKMITFREFCEREMARINALGVKCEIITQRNTSNIGLCRID